MRFPGLLAATCGLLLGCNDTPATTGPAGEGAVKVAVTTSGGDSDLDGYELRVDDRVGVAFAPIDQETYFLAAGTHELEISGVSPNCTVSEGLTRTVTVAAGEERTVNFRVVCQATGFQVRATTLGVDPDANGYQITLDGVTKATVIANGQAVVSRLEPGTYEVGLTGVSPNCTLDGASTRSVTVINAELSQLAFAFTCTASYGVVRVEAVTTGPRPDNTLTAEVSTSPAFDQAVSRLNVPGNGLTFVAPVTGTRYVRLVDVAPHCTVDGESLQELTVTVGGTVRDTAVARFEVRCTAGDATLRVIMAATGTDVPAAFSLNVTRLYDCGTYYGCSREFVDAFPVAVNGTTSIVLPSDYYEISPASGVICRWDNPYYATVTLPLEGTADVAFDLFCERPLVRVTAPTTGTNPDTQYFVTLWISQGYWGSYSATLGPLAPGETLESRVDLNGYGYWIELEGVASNCTVSAPNPTAPFSLDWGVVREVEFPVTCGP